MPRLSMNQAADGRRRKHTSKKLVERTARDLMSQQKKMCSRPNTSGGGGLVSTGKRRAPWESRAVGRLMQKLQNDKGSVVPMMMKGVDGRVVLQAAGQRCSRAATTLSLFALPLTQP